jgi:hypothetical protein
VNRVAKNTIEVLQQKVNDAYIIIE